jgi:hypothetical protein
MQVRASTKATGPFGPLLIAVFFGLLSGTGEAFGDLILQALLKLTGVGPAILWIAPVVNTLLFLVIALLLLLAARLVPVLARATVFTSVFSALAFLGWLALGFRKTIHPASLVLVAAGFAAVVARWSFKHPATAHRVWARGAVLLGLTTLASLAGISGWDRVRESVALRRLPVAAPSSPDVLIVVLDAARADHLSSYGYTRETSPVLDQLAAEGVLFENAISTSSYSLPAHVSLLSGLYPGEHKVSWLDYRIRPDVITRWLPDYMRDRGYRTAAFTGNTAWFTHEQGFDRGFVRFDDYYHSIPDRILRTVFLANRLRIHVLVTGPDPPAPRG